MNKKEMIEKMVNFFETYASNRFDWPSLEFYFGYTDDGEGIYLKFYVVPVDADNIGPLSLGLNVPGVCLSYSGIFDGEFDTVHIGTFVPCLCNKKLSTFLNEFLTSLSRHGADVNNMTIKNIFENI